MDQQNPQYSQTTTQQSPPGGQQQAQPARNAVAEATSDGQFPQNPQPSVPQSASSGQLQASQTQVNKHKKILVCEDDAFLREIYIDTLIKGGYTLDTASDGDESYVKIKQGGWDIILLDIIMPKRDGLQVMRTLKNEGGFQQTCPVVFLTNLDNDAEIKQALQLGNGYLIKSQLTPADLLKEVGLYLSKKA